MISYCSFSDDNFHSDVRCYSDGGTYVVEVARCRTVLDTHDLAPIGLPFDGETLMFGSADECISALKRLRREGYLVPMLAFEMLAWDE